MICGRGLGITGGTLDKLESIPGFNVHIDERRALAQLESIGVFIIGQTEDICPADRKLYALRDVTGTIPSQPLIVASIMSKKLAESLDRLVLDVKFGSGAFMKTHKEAKQLAASMTKVGKLMGVKVSYLLTPMDEPLGRAVGNALEVAECVEILQGGGPPDVIDLVLDLAAQVSTASRAQLAKWLSDGTAWRKFISLVYAQDGDASSLEKITEVHRAPIVHPYPAKSAGTVKKMDAETIGRAFLLLGGGRQTARWHDRLCRRPLRHQESRRTRRGAGAFALCSRPRRPNACYPSCPFWTRPSRFREEIGVAAAVPAALQELAGDTPASTPRA